MGQPLLNNIGEASLFLSLLIGLVGIFSLSAGILQKEDKFIHIGKRCINSIFALLTLTMVLLLYLLITKDYSNAYVSKNVSNDLSTLYSVTALWAGQEGSLLLWAWIMSIYLFIVSMVKTRDKLIPSTKVTILFVLSFFILLIVFIESPFALSLSAESNGRGLNPILQNIYMAIHPVTLYIGYIALTIPFAFAVGSILSKDNSNKWIELSKRWTYFSWIFLSAGLLLGSRWAYLELGWGGYWAWDPVENVALMPWLVLTAFIHSSMAQEKRSLLKRWNIFLIFLAFFLSIFGTFITRSGLISSVHSFAQSEIANYFIVFIFLIVIISFFSYYKNKNYIKSEEEITSLVSKENFFIFNNIFFLVITLTVFLGTTFPILSEFATGEKILVGPSFYNLVNFPNVLLLMLLMSIAPIIPWKNGDIVISLRFILVPLVLSLILGITTFVFVNEYKTSLVVFLSFLIITTMMKELITDFKIQYKNKGKTSSMLLFKLRRYCSFVVHLGIVLIVLGINFSSVFAAKYDISLKKSETAIIDNYKIELLDIYRNENEAKTILGAIVALYDGKNRYILNPEQNNYKYEGNREINKETEVAIYSTFAKDYYLILIDQNTKGNFNFKVYINPLVSFLWIGSFVSILGVTALLIRRSKKYE